MNRKTLFNIHFYLSSFFTPFLLLIAITGTSYLFGNKGSLKSTLIQENISLQSETKKEQVSTLLKKLDPSYSYEYLKDRKTSIQTRPTTRDYYNFKQTSPETFSLYKVEPNLLSRVIEVHKGHGPKLLKYFQEALGVSLIFIVLSGLIMSLQMKNRKKSAIVSMGIGFVILLSLFML